MSFTGQIEPALLRATLEKAIEGFKAEVSKFKQQGEDEIAEYLAKHPYRHFLWIIWWKRDRLSAISKLEKPYIGWATRKSRWKAEAKLRRVQDILLTLKDDKITNITLSEDDLILLRPFL